MQHEAESTESASSMQEQHQETIRWLQQQWENWEQLARTHEKTIEELRAHAERQQESLVWLEEQRSRWQEAASAREQIINELRDRVRRLEEFAQRARSIGPTHG